MRITVDLLGHHVEFTIDHPGEGGEPQREGSADALVERSDPWAPPIGFGPHRRADE